MLDGEGVKLDSNGMSGFRLLKMIRILICLASGPSPTTRDHTLFAQGFKYRSLKIQPKFSELNFHHFQGRPIFTGPLPPPLFR